MAAHRKLLVVGDPGSGKSTFLKRVAFQLCKEWAEGAPLPVRIEAAVLSTYIAQQHTRTGPADASSPEWIPVFLGAQCDEKNRGLPAEYFRAKLKAGGCHVLIDGLDETPDEASRERLAKLIRAAAAAFDGCRFVVTSRPEGKVPIADFEEALIGDLEPEAIRAFLAKVAKQLYASDETKERQFREELEAAVNGRREIRKMTRNPVMLTALAVLQHNNVRAAGEAGGSVRVDSGVVVETACETGADGGERLSAAVAGVGAGNAEARRGPQEAGAAGVGGRETEERVRQPRGGGAVPARGAGR